MRNEVLIGIALLGLASCGSGGKQAAALDRAAAQSDPAAASELRNQADAIRADGGAANLADPQSPAQNALAAAGKSAAADPTPAARPQAKPVDPQTGLTR